ncbi:MAG: hypothetical protein GW802_06785 [Armatimonadetes bacterium]|nr:hypothetical protein [Armatimonadota bacterium]
MHNKGKPPMDSQRAQADDPSGEPTPALAEPSPARLRHNPPLLLAASALTAAGALAGLYLLSSSLCGLHAPERLYLSGRCFLGDAVIALNTGTAVPAVAFALMAPLAVVTTVALSLFLNAAVRLSRGWRPQQPASRDHEEDALHSGPPTG